MAYNSETGRAAGFKGGLAKSKKYGHDHYVEMGRKGAKISNENQRRKREERAKQRGNQF